jgi:hypothetical protein
MGAKFRCVLFAGLLLSPEVTATEATKGDQSPLEPKAQVQTDTVIRSDSHHFNLTLPGTGWRPESKKADSDVLMAHSHESFGTVVIWVKARQRYKLDDEQKQYYNKELQRIQPGFETYDFKCRDVLHQGLEAYECSYSLEGQGTAIKTIYRFVFSGEHAYQIEVFADKTTAGAWMSAATEGFVLDNPKEPSNFTGDNLVGCLAVAGSLVGLGLLVFVLAWYNRKWVFKYWIKKKDKMKTEAEWWSKFGS